MKKLRERRGIESGAPRKLRKKSNMVSTPTIQASRVDTEMTGQGMSSIESIPTRDCMMIERGLSGRSKI
jgi:hypothetical protein